MDNNKPSSGGESGSTYIGYSENGLPIMDREQIVNPVIPHRPCRSVDNDYAAEGEVAIDGDRDFYYDLAASSNALPYTPVVLEPKLPMFRELSNEPFFINDVPCQMHKQAWLCELEYENDQYLKSYLGSGIIDGFEIVDDVNNIPTYDNINYKSVQTGPAAEVIDGLILSELKEHKYVVTDVKPKCIHSLGAVPKSGGGFRPITDCKRPEGVSVNSYMLSTAGNFSYQSVDYVTELMERNDFSASVDIAAAYRSISISPKHWTCQGVRWTIDGESRYLMDTRLCFGIRCAPFVFTQISNFVVRAMARRGFPRIACYLDDYIIFAPSFHQCQFIQRVLIHLLISLGFEIAWKKCSSPSTYTRYLGLNFDSVRMEISLPEDKLIKLKNELAFFDQKVRSTKRQIQKLVGYLAHCAKVVKGGRLFSRRLVALLRGIGTKKRIRLPESIKLDLNWWRAFMETFNGSASIVRFNFGAGPTVWTDACITGYGVYGGGDWQAGMFNSEFNIPDFSDHHGHLINMSKPVVCPKDDNVNYWELLAVLQAVRRYSYAYCNCHLIVATDNTQVVAMVNGGSSINLSCLEVLREIFWIAAIFNIFITLKHIPGVENVIADKLSRIYPRTGNCLLQQLSLCCSSSRPVAAGPEGGRDHIFSVG